MTLRLLPLLSSATEIVHALGLGEFQIGRSHECDFPKSVEALPACTKASIPLNVSSGEIDRLVRERAESLVSIYEIDSELLKRLNPTHIITQTQCNICAVSLGDVQKAMQQQLDVAAEVVPLEALALDGLWNDILRVARTCGHADAGAALVKKLQDRLSAIEATAQRAKHRPSLAAIEWLDPLMAAGNWVPELIEIAGGRSLLGVTGQHSPYMTFEALRESDPDVIAAMPCGFDLDRTRAEMVHLTQMPGWKDLRAVREHRVFICDGNQYMNRSGPRLVDSARIFAELLHPDLFHSELRGVGWEPFDATA